MVVSDWEAVVLDIWRAGQRLSAVGPGPVDVHLEHGKRLAAQLSPPRLAIDIGSGAGIPGLVLAGVWPESRWLLLDAAARRVRLLEEAVGRLGWIGRVEVRHGRAEAVAREPEWRGAADLVTARSFGPPAATAECGAGFLAVDGLLVVTEPPDDTPGRWSSSALSQIGLAPVAPAETDVVRIQRLLRVGDVPDSVPRRPGIPQKRPLF